MAQLPFELDLTGSPPTEKATKEQLEGGINASITQAYNDMAAGDTASRDRANHTGTQPIASVTGLQGALDGKAASVHTHTAAQISDSTAAGRSVLTGNAAAGRTALGLGTLATKSVVANADLDDMGEATIKGRAAGGGSGKPQNLTASQVRQTIGLGTAATQNVEAFAAAAHTHAAAQISDSTPSGRAVLTGTPSDGRTALGLGGLATKDVVSNADLDDMAEGRIKGRPVGEGSGKPQNLTPAQMRAMLGIDRVNNTSDSEKPISQAVALALGTKVDTHQLAGSLARYVTRASLYRAEQRPGDAPEGFGVGVVGSTLPPHTYPVAQYQPLGNALRVQGAQVIAPMRATRLTPGKVYSAFFEVMRIVDPQDPLSDAVEFGISWLTATRDPVAGSADTVIWSGPLRTIDGVKRVTETFFALGVSGVDFLAPQGAVYFRPYVRTYGSGGVTALGEIATPDVTLAWRAIDAVKQIEGLDLPDLDSRIADAEQAATDAMAAAALAGKPFATRQAFLDAVIPAPAVTAAHLCSDGYIIAYRRDETGTAATTADGGTWSPATIITPDHWGAVGDGANNDAPAMRACFDWAAARSSGGRVERVHLLGNRNYYHPGYEPPIIITGSLRIIGQGIETTRYTRHDFTGRTGFGGGRFDAIRNQTLGAVFSVSGIGFHGDFGTLHTVDGNDVTVAYRFAGGNQYEGLLAGGTTTSVVLGPSAIAVDGAYDDHRIHINHGSGRGTVRVLKNYVGSSRTADLADANGNIRPVIAGQSADATSYVQIGRFDVGMCLVVSGLDAFEVTACGFNDIRNQVINYSNCRKVRITDCMFTRCARGGISGRRNQDVVNTRHIFSECGDDIIFNAQELAGDGMAINTIVSDILAIDCVGMRFIGARRLQVSNYTAIRPMLHGLTIGHNGVEQPVNQNSIQITGVQIIDPLNRNAVAYDVAGGLFAGIQVISTSAVSGSDFRVPGVVESGETEANNPRDMINTITASTPPAWYQPTAWTKISGNSVIQTLKPGQKVSDANGRGSFYFLGTLLSNGYIDDVLDEASVSCPAVLCLGPQHKLSITDNDLHVNGNVPCVLFTNRTLFRGNETRTQDCNIDFDGALTDVVVGHNRLTGGTGGVQINHQDQANNYRYSVAVTDNVVDVDPYFQHPLRAVDGNGAPNGKWTDGALWAIDTNRCIGVTLLRNRIKNVLYPWRGSVGGSTLRDNIIEARPSATATQGVFDADNIGVGAITADGEQWQLLDVNLDPTSPTYLQTSASPLSAATRPSSGYWIVGQRVRCSDPSTGIAEWVRVTSGNGHLLDTDWRVIYLSEAHTTLSAGLSVTNVATAYGSRYRSTNVTWTFPRPYRSGTLPVITVNAGHGDVVGWRLTNLTTNAATFTLLADSSISGEIPIRATATGLLA